MRHTSAQVKAFCLVMGMEDSQERLDARDQLVDRHERQPHRYPCEWVWDVWEELGWR